MNLGNKKRIVLADFSPAGSTRKIGIHLAGKLSAASGILWAHRPFTLPGQRTQALTFDENAWVILAMPVYAGRIPSLLLPYMAQMKGEGAKAFLLNTYGNRDYDDALREMEALSIHAGMTVVGGAAIVTRHVFSDVIAKGRPDEKDLQAIDRQIPRIYEAFLRGNPVTMPGNEELSYYKPTGEDGESVNMIQVKPSTKPGCIRCLQCVRSCPLGSIDEDDPTYVPGKCMKCCSCVLACPLKLKHFDDPGFLSHKKALEEKLVERREPEFFLPSV